MVDFMPADQVRVWPEYKNIRYAGIAGIFVMTCRHIAGYAGLTYLISYAGEGMPGYLTHRVGGPAYKSGVWPTVITGI
jgi:hypothetical protein